jgi:hypothetical protein
MVDTEKAPPVASGEEIKPYKIHVSCRLAAHLLVLATAHC